MHFDLNANIVSIITLLGVVTANIVIIINALRSSIKLEQIHTSTNGSLAELKRKVAKFEEKSLIDNEEIKGMQELIGSLKRTDHDT
jgi:hypothetical protein